jgi:hypothetical protein
MIFSLAIWLQASFIIALIENYSYALSQLLHRFFFNLDSYNLLAIAPVDVLTIVFKKLGTPENESILQKPLMFQHYGEIREVRRKGKYIKLCNLILLSLLVAQWQPLLE